MLIHLADREMGGGGGGRGESIKDDWCNKINQETNDIFLCFF